MGTSALATTCKTTNNLKPDQLLRVGHAGKDVTGVDELVAPTAEDEGAEGEDDQQREDDGLVEVQPEEESADLKIAPAPVRPPAAVVEEHRITHYPYRSWCDECREGRGLGEQRGRHVGRPHDMPLIGIA